MKVIRNKYLPVRGYTAMNLFGLLFCRPDAKITPQLINHERIHTAQMLEMLIVFFYLWYVVEWVVKIFTPGRSYYRISFEREAYRHMNDLKYLKNRKHFAWMKYIRQKRKKTHHKRVRHD